MPHERVFCKLHEGTVLLTYAPDRLRGIGADAIIDVIKKYNQMRDCGFIDLRGRSSHQCGPGAQIGVRAVQLVDNIRLFPADQFEIRFAERYGGHTPLL
uniref:Uncharacterized protein n=1 Tax=Candidatus Methanogaster sp. ANME-2c ERB4 TaxID=2759911 RepID=A0A7G9YBQ0_9EURY|nr:hypothetical protein EBNGKMBP_00006 [Methanosarcinales archaeon ANME-2c ERB4]